MTRAPSSDEEFHDDVPAWVAVRVYSTLESIERELVAPALGLLDALHPDDSAHWPITLCADDIQQVRTIASDLHDRADVLQHLGEQLPEEADVEVSYEAVAEAAAADLRDLSIDVSRVRDAASFLTAADGWGALASGLMWGHHFEWGDATVMDVLGAFRDADEQAVRAVSAEAGVSPADEFAELSPESVERLAEALRRRAALEG